MLANPLTYEIMTPASVGVPPIAWCWASTPAGTLWRIALRSSGISLDAAELDRSYHRFVELADRKKDIYDQDLILPQQRT